MAVKESQFDVSADLVVFFNRCLVNTLVEFSFISVSFSSFHSHSKKLQPAWQLR